MSYNDDFDRHVAMARAQVRRNLGRRRVFAKAVSLFTAASALVFAFEAFWGN